MKLESEKLSVRVQNGVQYNSILSDIYFIFYKKFTSYLPLYEQINKIDNNFIKQECIKELTQQKMPEKILNIYVDNVEFFKEKYSITQQQISSLGTVEQKGIFVLEKIIDKISFITAPKNLAEQNLKDIVFGKKNEKIIGCPIIIQNKYTEMDEENLSDDKLLDLLFLQKNNFSVKTLFNIMSKKMLDTKTLSSESSNKYYFDKKYFDSFIAKMDLNSSGFHFEKFIIFDFDKTGFINNPEISFELPIIFDPKVKKLNFELFYYSCLNAGFFLSDSSGIKDVVINPEYFKKIFPLNIDGDGISRQLYDLEVIEKYFPNFIKNVRYGLRLVCRQSVITDNEKQNSKYKYSEEVFKGIKNPFYKTQCYIDSTKYKVLERPSSFYYYENKKIKDLIELEFTNLEYSIIKNKSYVLFIEVGTKQIRRNWTPLISVYSDKALNTIGSEMAGDVLLGDIHNFIDDLDNKIIDELKEKMVNIIDFKYVFENLIPINAISLLQNLDAASSVQKQINSKLKDNKENSALIANSLEKSFSSLITSSLKDDKEY